MEPWEKQVGNLGGTYKILTLVDDVPYNKWELWLWDSTWLTLLLFKQSCEEIWGHSKSDKYVCYCLWKATKREDFIFYFFFNKYNLH